MSGCVRGVSVRVGLLPPTDPAKPLRRRLAQSLRCALDDTMASLLPSPVLAVVQVRSLHGCGDCMRRCGGY
eukprot:m.413429 g.413429  ORF g.413429 m.413429 type:complete len:71 (-) comp21265_c0_seq14:913-1125(-)